VDGILATRSEEGMTLVYRGPGTAAGDEIIIHQPARAREVFDVAGAGDTVVATFAAGLGAGLSMGNAAHLANRAAGVVVAKTGTAVALPGEILNAEFGVERVRGEVKILTLDPAIDQAETWRRKGYKIGFTNGCFDLLHPGHISLIDQASAACDKLILGLNSDLSVQRLKGPTRPVQSEAARATVLASLSKVDLVVIFGEDTPLDLIKMLRPDCLIKGADYDLDQVVGAKEVMSWGGQVVLADLVSGQSTTGMISRANIPETS
jgi:D-beta-D-heptose 7-phosphate kinase/D-beta-D-heptose 1-phosphate adenosyltransferase